MLRVERCLMQDWYCPGPLMDADVHLSSSQLWSEVGGCYPGLTTENIVAQGCGGMGAGGGRSHPRAHSRSRPESTPDSVVPWR